MGSLNFGFVHSGMMHIEPSLAITCSPAVKITTQLSQYYMDGFVWYILCFKSLASAACFLPQKSKSLPPSTYFILEHPGNSHMEESFGWTMLVGGAEIKISIHHSPLVSYSSTYELVLFSFPVVHVSSHSSS